MKNSSILPQRKIIVKKQDIEAEEIEKMLNELKGNTQKKNLNQGTNFKNNNNNNDAITKNNNNNNQNNINNNNQKNNYNININNQNPNINQHNTQIESKINSNPISEPVEFKQQTSNLLDNFKFKKEKDLDVQLPVVYRGVDYIYLLSHLKEKKIPETISNIEKNNFENALIESEKILYYLTNIIPKEN